MEPVSVTGSSTTRAVTVLAPAASAGVTGTVAHASHESVAGRENCSVRAPLTYSDSVRAVPVPLAYRRVSGPASPGTVNAVAALPLLPST